MNVQLETFDDEEDEEEEENIKVYTEMNVNYDKQFALKGGSNADKTVQLGSAPMTRSKYIKH